jgi:hypothetical protein
MGRAVGQASMQDYLEARLREQEARKRKEKVRRAQQTQQTQQQQSPTSSDPDPRTRAGVWYDPDEQQPPTRARLVGWPLVLEQGRGL